MSTRRRNWLLIFFVVTFIVVLRVTTTPAPPETSFFDTRVPQVVVDGGSGRPPHTMIALAHARSIGADAVRLGLRQSADGAIVLFGPELLDGITDGAGSVAAQELEALQRLDAAFGWSPDGETFPYRGKGVRVPTLDSALARFPGLPMHIVMQEFGDDGAEALCALLREHPSDGQILVGADGLGAMVSFRQRCPHIATSAAPFEVALFLLHARLGIAGIYRSQAVLYEFEPERFAMALHTAEMAELAASRGLRLHGKGDELPADWLASGYAGWVTQAPERLIALRAAAEGSY